MPIPSFNDYRDVALQYIVDKAALPIAKQYKDASELYLAYINWLIDWNNQQKVSTSELLMQLKIINLYMMQASEPHNHKLKGDNIQTSLDGQITFDDAGALQETVKGKIGRLTRELNSFKNNITTSVSSILPFKGAIIASVLLGGLISFTLYALEASLMTMTSGLMIGGAAIAPFVISAGSYLINKLAISLNKPMNQLLAADITSLEISKTLFEDVTLTAKSEQNQLVKQTTLCMYNNLFPKKEASPDADPANDEVDLLVLRDSLKAK